MHATRGCGYGLGTVGAVWLAAWCLWSVPVSGQRTSVTVPKAQCGPGERPESGLQGQMTLAERFSAPQAYNCNLERVGQFAGEGGSWHMATLDTCAYYSTTPNPDMTHPGTVVIDATAPRNPQASTYLDSSTMRSSNESLEVNEARKLLFGGDFERTTMEIYDLSDCRRPVLKGSIDFRDLTAHGTSITADGRTYYAGYLPPDRVYLGKAGAVAVDVSDPAKPRELARWDRPEGWGSHAATVSADGNRVYVVSSPRLVILDSSDIQARKPNAQFRLISVFDWTSHGLSGGQFALPTTIKGRPYVIESLLSDIKASAAGCRGSGARIVDISDERNPKFVSSLLLEVNDPANCSKVANDPTAMQGYSNTYCSTDNDQDAKMVACGFAEAGLRVFDIRDVTRPREIAYYKPQAWRTQIRKGSYFGVFGGVFERPTEEAAKKAGTFRPRINDHTADAVMHPVFKKNGTEIWFVSADGGFQIVRFTDRFKAAEKGLF